MADEGAKPSPSPTCRAAQAGISAGHLHSPLPPPPPPPPAQEAVASASPSKAIASSPLGQAIDPGNTLHKRALAGSSAATQASLAARLDVSKFEDWQAAATYSWTLLMSISSGAERQAGTAAHRARQRVTLEDRLGSMQADCNAHPALGS